MPNSTRYFVLKALTLMAAAIALPALHAASCEDLLNVMLPKAKITVAQAVSAGTFSPPYGPAIDKIPAFCRVAGVSQPTADSYIRFEVWLPASGWNGKFLGVGNGGFAGSIDYSALGRVLKRGYATAATDTGHEADGGDASWAFKHPEKVADFGYRGLHETVKNAKTLIQSFYQEPPRHSYFDACSDGGREALMEAQRFPEDFDGILAGAPANFWTHMLTSGVDITKTIYRNPAGYVSSVKIPAIQAATLAACDAQDGVKDGIINDPSRCRFDPTVLRCKGEESRACLTEAEISSLKKYYAGGRNSHGELIFPGFTPGSEEGPGGWGSWITGPAPGFGAGIMFMENYFRYMVFDDPAWNPVTANVDAAERMADEKTARVLNATDPDLRRFQARGGKLVLYHGWNDPAISPLNTINYYNNVLSKMGAQTAESFIRLYMVPGMQHCVSGPGPNWLGQGGTTTAKGPEHGIFAALEEWVEKGTAPDTVIATKYIGDNSSKGVQMTRPLCPYPQVAKYKGSGDTNDYTSFTCVANP